MPVIVDAAAEPDVRPFLHAGASIVISSGHKAMGAPTSGLLCGRKEIIRACYLQNWGIGRAMKVGKEGIAGMIAALERWYGRGGDKRADRYAEVAAVLAAKLEVHPTATAHRVRIQVTREARQIANLIREGDPAIWVNEASGRTLVLDLRNLTPADAAQVADRIQSAASSNTMPREDVPYHDLYWSEDRLMRVAGLTITRTHAHRMPPPSGEQGQAGAGKQDHQRTIIVKTWVTSRWRSAESLRDFAYQCRTKRSPPMASDRLNHSGRGIGRYRRIHADLPRTRTCEPAWDARVCLVATMPQKVEMVMEHPENRSSESEGCMTA